MALLTRHSVRRVSVMGVVLATAVVSSWRPMGVTAARERLLGAQNRPVDPAGTRALQTPVDRGSTYEWLERQAIRVTVRFPEVVAVSERAEATSADVRTRLMDLAGNDVATLSIHRVDAMSESLEFLSTDGADMRPISRMRSRPTLDWASRQAYSLWKDRTAGTSQFDWQRGLLRPRGAPVRDIDRDISELRTEWPGELSATVVRTATNRRVLTGAPARGHSFISRLKRDNADLGVSRWYVDEQVLAWSFPGLTQGYLDAGRLTEVGGWPFTPDLAWVNVQSFAFHYFHSLVAAQGFVARRRNGWKDGLLQWAMPTVLANEPGCDGLHWLDRSVFRPCCDSHDRCYRKYGCSSSSWWLWWRSWTCDTCNVGAVFCFVSGGRLPYFQSAD